MDHRDRRPGVPRRRRPRRGRDRLLMQAQCQVSTEPRDPGQSVLQAYRVNAARQTGLRLNDSSNSIRNRVIEDDLQIAQKILYFFF